MMQDRIFARAVELAGELDQRQQDLLRALCDACAVTMEARLREGMTPEDCGEPFVTAVSLQALASMTGFDREVTEFRAGDLTVKQGSAGNRETMARDLRWQAEELMGPYLKDRFLFTGV